VQLESLAESPQYRSSLYGLAAVSQSGAVCEWRACVKAEDLVLYYEVDVKGQGYARYVLALMWERQKLKLKSADRFHERDGRRSHGAGCGLPLVSE
jgi:hypothetical protein